MDNKHASSLHSFNWTLAWLTITTLIAVCAAGTGWQLYVISQQQRTTLEMAQTALLNHEKTLHQLESDISHLTLQSTEQHAQLITHDKNINQAADQLLLTNQKLSATHAEATAIKTEMNSWQINFVSTMLKIETKTDANAEQLNDIISAITNINEQLANIKAQVNDQHTDQLKSELNTLKTTLDQVISALPAENTTTQAIRRRLHPELVTQ